MPCPPKPDVPKLRKPPSKLGISDTPEPMPELEKPEWPKDEFPRLELPKRESPKFPIERLEENDENDENRVDAGTLLEKRFELNPRPDECRFDAVTRPLPKGENPELFRSKEAFREFPNECHWPSVRTLLP
jgi:hypothetical protein